MWGTLVEADDYLASVIDGAGWSDLSDDVRLLYLNTANNRLIDHPRYDFPTEIEREQIEGQALYAAWLNSNGDDSKEKPSGVKSYSLLDYSVTYGKIDSDNPFAFGGLLLPQTVQDKLSKYLRVPGGKIRQIRPKSKTPCNKRYGHT